MSVIKFSNPFRKYQILLCTQETFIRFKSFIYWPIVRCLTPCYWQFYWTTREPSKYPNKQNIDMITSKYFYSITHVIPGYPYRRCSAPTHIPFCASIKDLFAQIKASKWSQHSCYHRNTSRYIYQPKFETWCNFLKLQV